MRVLLVVFLLAQCSWLQAHEWSEFDPPPDVLLERLVEIIEAASADGQFQGQTEPGCVPHDCLDQKLVAATSDDLNWLAEDPAADLPSSHFGRLPPSLTYDLLFDLVGFLNAPDHTNAQSELAERLEVTLQNWGSP